MIARLRRVHRSLHRVLWPGVALLFAAALAGRPAVEVPDDWAADLGKSVGQEGGGDRSGLDRRVLEWSSSDAFGAWPARLALWSDGSLELTPLRPIDKPELLVYWVPEPPAGERLPDSARLLGVLRGLRTQRYALPARAVRPSDGRGHVVVYSLGHQQIVSVASLPGRADRGSADATRESDS